MATGNAQIDNYQRASASIRIVKELFDAEMAGDVARMLEALDSSVVINEAKGLPFSGEWRGHEGFRALMDMILRGDLEPRNPILGEDITSNADGSVVIAVNRLSFASKRTGREANDILSLVMFRFRDGKIVEIAPRFDSELVKTLSD
jgi:ketosteroid isomerase-like protein